MLNGNLFPVNFSSALSDSSENKGESIINKKYLLNILPTNQKIIFNNQETIKLKAPVSLGFKK